MVYFRLRRHVALSMALVSIQKGTYVSAIHSLIVFSTLCNLWFTCILDRVMCVVMHSGHLFLRCFQGTEREEIRLSHLFSGCVVVCVCLEFVAGEA